MKLVPDTSVIIDGKLPEWIEEQGNVKEVIIPIAVLDELQAQASKGREPGFVGLEQLKRLRVYCEEKGIKFRFTGQRPTLEEIKLAKAGRIDAIIRDVAKNEDAYLITADYVQHLVAEAEGVKSIYLEPEIKTEGLEFERFFDESTLSVHLKEGVEPIAKKGKPGEFKLVKLSNEKLSKEDIEKIIMEIIEASRVSEEASVEIERRGATVIQFKNYRISIARPPFSDGLEVTIVRPLVKLSLEDYKPSKKLIERLKERAEGIIIAGPPGSGKSTLAASIAEFYLKMGKIVKTMESPRDLQVSEEITQYAPLEGDFEKTADILLLVRPDYTIFDEVRKTRDFQIFADLRLAGVGMIGVVHSSDAISAIQRFIGRIELGMIPHIVDTVIFVKNGEIKKIYTLQLVVKIPTGMKAEDLARPVVEIRDFETGKLEYEIYSYGEENIVVPVAKEETNAIIELAKQKIYEVISKFDKKAEIEFKGNRAIVRVSEKAIPKLIGRGGKTISNIEKKLGIGIDVEPKYATLGKEVKYEVREVGNSLEFSFDPKLANKTVNFYVEGKFVFSGTVSRKGVVRISKASEIGKTLVKALMTGKEIKVIM